MIIFVFSYFYHIRLYLIAPYRTWILTNTEYQSKYAYSAPFNPWRACFFPDKNTHKNTPDPDPKDSIQISNRSEH